MELIFNYKLVNFHSDQVLKGGSGERRYKFYSQARRVLVSKFLSFYDRKRGQFCYLMLYRLLILLDYQMSISQYLFHDRKKLLKKSIFSNNLNDLKRVYKIS